MKFHPPHVSKAGHEYSIGDHGLAVQIQLAGEQPVALNSDEAIELRAWLNAAELSTPEKANASS